MVTPRKKGVRRRPVQLDIRTYDRLEKWRLAYMQRENNPNLTRDEVVNFLMDEIDRLRDILSELYQKEPRVAEVLRQKGEGPHYVIKVENQKLKF